MRVICPQNLDRCVLPAYKLNQLTGFFFRKPVTVVEFSRACPACKNRMRRVFLGRAARLTNGGEPWYWLCSGCERTEVGGIESPLTQAELDELGWTNAKTDTGTIH
jgi:hypothetical protein